MTPNVLRSARVPATVLALMCLGSCGPAINLRGANLVGADLQQKDLRGANLGHAQLRRANLRGAKLSGANLAGADLSEASLMLADLRGVDGAGARFDRADLTGAKLSSANLARASLRRAKLGHLEAQGTNFRDAALQGAEVGEADLSRSNLAGANLLQASYLARARHCVPRVPTAPSLPPCPKLQPGPAPRASAGGPLCEDRELCTEHGGPPRLAGVHWRSTICPDGSNSDQSPSGCEDHLLSVLPTVALLTTLTGPPLRPFSDQRMLFSAEIGLQVAGQPLPLSSRRGSKQAHTVDAGGAAQAWEKTHGQEIQGRFAPYLAAYAAQNGIDLDRLLRVLFPAGAPSAKESRGVMITSSDHNTGSWTYFVSRAVLVYQAVAVKYWPGGANPGWLVLYSRVAPAEVIIDRFVAEWHLALVSPDYRRVADQAFKTVIKHRTEEGMWDVIDTRLILEQGRPVVRINYSHSGGGGPRDQGYEFRFQVARPATLASPSDPVLQLSEARQTVDAYTR